MVEKVLLRVTEHHRNSERDAVAAWCSAKAESWPAFAEAMNPVLWEETERVCAGIARDAQAKLDRLGVDLGGPGHYPLLYFLTRHLRPQTVVETGVSAGWSSQAILTALAKNGDGRLFSSDFPYFRLKDPERYVGCVVDDHLKDRWRLLIDGDKNNLPLIARQTESIDLFHYDSDKTFSGREFAWRCVKERLSPRAVVLFDDIQDNFHFRDLVASCGWPYRVFAFSGKYAGMTEPG